SAEKPAEPGAARPAVKKIESKPRPVASAQGLADGSLAGTVSDSSGAVIPGVTLTVSSRTVNPTGATETEVQTAVTGETGRYSFPALTPGQYSLKAEVPGFMASRTVLEVERGQTTVRNVSLVVGSIAQRVVVTAPGQPKPAPLPGVPQRIRVGGNVVA